MVYIPEKFYVARQKRGEDEVLAFMVVADKEHTKAFQNSKGKADAWAEPGHYYAEHKGHANLGAIYVANKPLTGFRLVTNVSRYSTSNVVWRIMHPEGFEFEITSDNLMDLMDTNTCIEGVFQEEMFFTHTKKLVSTKTKLFADMIQKEEVKKEHKVKSNVLEPGSTIKITIPHRYYPEDESKKTSFELVYMGKFHTCGTNKNRPMLVTNKSTARPVVYDPVAGKYRTFTELPEFEVLDNELKTVDRAETIKALNEQIRSNANNTVALYYQDGHIPNESLPIFFSEKGYNYSDLKVQYEKVPASEVDTICYNKIYRINDYRVFGFYFEDNSGRQMHTYKAEYRDAYERDDTNLKTGGFLGEKIKHVQENGFPDVSTDIFSHKEVIGYYGPFNGHYNSLTKLGLPETIEVGRYVLGE